MTTVDAAPVVMVHGWGGSFRRTWQEPGWQALLADAGRTVIGVDLLGHGDAPKPHDVESYADMTPAVADATVGIEQFDAIGFSLGAMTLLEYACRHPERFQRLVLCGIGKSAVEPRPEANLVLQALKGDPEADDDVRAQVFVQYANQPGNDREALTACMEAIRPRFDAERLAKVTCPVLIVIGDRDEAGPGEPLAERLPNAKVVTLRNVDHFATTESFGCIDAALEFLDAVP